LRYAVRIEGEQVDILSTDTGLEEENGRDVSGQMARGKGLEHARVVRAGKKLPLIIDNLRGTEVRQLARYSERSRGGRGEEKGRGEAVADQTT